MSSFPLVALPASEQSADSGAMNISDGRSCLTPSYDEVQTPRRRADYYDPYQQNFRAFQTSLADEADGFANLGAILLQRLFTQVSLVGIQQQHPTILSIRPVHAGKFARHVWRPA
ncbi:hypothetical protein PG985_003156 [Apiospora marii]|uniref:uncharacterized protein n=1 Tax=Apiospora marii TaxID=335849 RepID=UPI0031304D49